MPRYELVVDYGKPYNEFHNSLSSLKSALSKLKKFEEKEDLPFLDIHIYEGEKEVTDEIFKKLRLN